MSHMALVIHRIKFVKDELFYFVGWNKNISFLDRKLIEYIQYYSYSSSPASQL